MTATPRPVAGPPPRRGHPLGRLALLHPFPSALDAALTAVLAWIAGAGTVTALVLAAAMFAFQASIGALNDLVDAPHDAVASPSKPIPSGLVSLGVARAVVLAGGAVGGVLSALVSPAAAIVGLAGYACGVAYDLRLKAEGLGWVAYAAAFPLLLVYAWVGAGAGLPPDWIIVLPVAAIAGPMLHLANGLVDPDGDRRTGSRGLVVRLGTRRATVLLVLLAIAVYGLAWVLLLTRSSPVLEVVLAGLASGLAIVGIAGSASRGERRRAWGWTLQAVAIALLSVAYLAGAVEIR
jgi:4-hydroxybenzoate polyprenyltransferase